MLEFRIIKENVDLIKLYKDNPEAQLTLKPNVTDKFSDYIC